jgi:hypothetical protein
MKSATGKMILVGSVLAALIPGPAVGNDADAGAAHVVTQVEVRRLDGEQTGWVAETDNFRIYHPDDSALARKTAGIAEKTRTAVYRKWFGKVVPDWGPRCEVFLHADGAEYFQGTGISAAALPGLSTMHVDNGRVISRRIDLLAANRDLLAAVLPHEVTHIVMWSWFGQRDFPQWVNEGMAVLTEPRDRVERHLRNLPRHRRKGELLPISRLVQSRDYPERRLLGPFYAQSVSLVDFLTDAKDPAAFARFVRDGMQRGYEAASQRHYGWSLEEMDQRWRRHAFGDDDEEGSD